MAGLPGVPLRRADDGQCAGAAPRKPTAKNKAAAKENASASAVKVNTDKSPVRVWVDQIGYRPDVRKLLIVAADQPIPKDLDLQLVNAKTGKVVWKLAGNADALKIKNNGNKDGESGDYLAHLDLSGLKTAGRYYVLIASAQPAERSHLFNVAENVYYASGIAAWKTFYFQAPTAPSRRSTPARGTTRPPSGAPGRPKTPRSSAGRRTRTTLKSPAR